MGGSSDREILDSGVGCRVKFEDNDASNMSCRGKVGRLVASEEAFPVVKVEGDGEEEVIFASLDQLIAACEMCTRAGAKKCSRCNTARYCSADCQLAHWRAAHKAECKRDVARRDTRLPGPEPALD